MTDTRKWSKHHLEAGYHLREWAAPAADSELIGTYSCVINGQPTTVEVSWLAEGSTGGPELELDWKDFHTVTVLDEETAIAYLVMCGAITVEDDKQEEGG